MTTRAPCAAVPLLILLLAWAPIAAAFQLVPISREYAPSGSGATQSYEVVNDTPARIAVELSVVKRLLDVDGAETTEPDEADDFLVYPWQLILEPGVRQTVRVTWVGEPELERERCFRLVAGQVSLEALRLRKDPTAKPRGQIELLYRFLGSMYVSPPGARAEVTVESAGRERSAGREQLVVLLANAGSGRADLREYALQLTDGAGHALTLTGAQLGITKASWIFAGSRRRLAVAWPKQLRAGELKAEVVARR